MTGSRRTLWLALIFVCGLVLPLVTGLYGSAQTGGPEQVQAQGQADPTPADLPVDPALPLPPLASLDPALWPKVEPGLLKAALAASDEPLSFIVVLEEQAELDDLPLARGGPVVARRPVQRQAVVSALQATAERSQAAIRAYLDHAQASGLVRRYTPFWIFNGLAVTASRDALFNLAAREEVEVIRADRKRWLDTGRDEAGWNREEDGTPRDVDGVSLPHPLAPVPSLPLAVPEWNLEKIRADLVRSALGIDGSGVVVASMDTGVDWQHPALLSRYRGYNPKGLPNHLGNWETFTDEDYRYPGDGNGHGTHTTGIVLGEEVGVAPGAQWIAAKVFHNQGYTQDSWLHAGFQWLMAPAGDASRAPDIVTASWGSEFGTDQTFRPDVKALRAAGILVVFSAGNAGPNAGTIGAPASFPESFSAGAVDFEDDVPGFSSRGPSPFGEVKPEVVAPGVNIRSTEPGGGYGTRSGTSMAVPHVAGLAALLLQAEPTLSVTATEQIITRTAVPLGSPVPNNDSGWGRIDAYAAVGTVAEVGFIEGWITRASDGAPVPGAEVAVALRDQPPFVQVVTSADGRYQLALPPGIYDVRVTAFGYLPALQLAVKTAMHQTTSLDMALALAPAGAFFGRVTDAETGAPLSATLRLANVPLVANTDPRTGLYSLSLPPGTYTVTVASPRHRLVHSAVTVDLNAARNVDFQLLPAPSILLVDSGAWYYNNQAGFVQQSLEDLDYLYDLWRIKNLPGGVPKPADLTPYDIVVWCAPEDAPGFVGASKAITTYLEAGGRLLITGQDVAYWDGGGTGTFAASYFREYLRAAFVKDDSGVLAVSGAPGGPLDGLAFSLEDGEGAGDQRYPDVVEPWRVGESTPVASYDATSQYAGLAVDVCVPYRALYLAFGLEGINSRPMRQTVVARALDYLLATPVEVDFQLSPGRLARVTAPGSVVTYTFTLRNTGQQIDSFSLELGPHQMPISLWDESFTRPLTGNVTLDRCSGVRLGVRVEVPAGLNWNTLDRVPLVVGSERARAAGTVMTRTLEIETKTPAPVLLVDDDRWYDLEEAYTTGLSANDYPFDVWDMQDGRASNARPLALSHISLYPLVVWFTGYDWYNTLSLDEEQMLARYLDRGGRLVFSSQDYLYTNGLTQFGIDYLGVLTFTEDVTTTWIEGVAKNPVGTGLGPFLLDFPFPNHADALISRGDASPAFTGDQGQVVALTRDALSTTQPGTGYRTVFLAFPMETMQPGDAALFLYRAVNWLAPLARSTLTVNHPVAAAGDRLTYQLHVRNDSPWPLPAARLVAPLPAGTQLVPGSLIGADYEVGERILRWGDGLAPGEVHTVTFQLDLPTDVVAGTSFTTAASMEDGIGLRVDRENVVRVNVPDLTSSQKWADTSVARPGDRVTYTLALRNTGTLDARTVTVSDTLPAGLTLEPDSLFFSAGQGEVVGNAVHWRGPVGRHGLVIVTYSGRVSPAQRTPLVNTASIQDDFGDVVACQTVVRVSNLVFLPVVRAGREATNPSLPKSSEHPGK